MAFCFFLIAAHSFICIDNSQVYLTLVAKGIWRFEWRMQSGMASRATRAIPCQRSKAGRISTTWIRTSSTVMLCNHSLEVDRTPSRVQHHQSGRPVGKSDRLSRGRRGLIVDYEAQLFSRQETSYYCIKLHSAPRLLRVQAPKLHRASVFAGFRVQCDMPFEPMSVPRSDAGVFTLVSPSSWEHVPQQQRW